MDDQKRDPSAELQTAAVALAEAFHTSMMAYWNRVVVPFAESVTVAYVSPMDRVGKALRQAEQRRITALSDPAQPSDT